MLTNPVTRAVRLAQLHVQAVGLFGLVFQSCLFSRNVLLLLGRHMASTALFPEVNLCPVPVEKGKKQQMSFKGERLNHNT